MLMRLLFRGCFVSKKTISKFFSSLWFGSDNVTLRLVGRISLEEEPEHLFSIFKPLLVERANFKTITIDLSDAEFIYPSALILLIGIRYPRTYVRGTFGDASFACPR